MSKSINGKARLLFVSLGLMCLVATGAWAEIGSGDSALFSLNTQTAAGVGEGSDLPQRDHLGGCYPNPFNPLTTISYELVQKAAVELRVYDLQGRLVRILLDGDLRDGGHHEAQWNGRDGQGKSVAAGVYVYRLVTENYVNSRRMTLVK